MKRIEKDAVHGRARVKKGRTARRCAAGLALAAALALTGCGAAQSESAATSQPVQTLPLPAVSETPASSAPEAADPNAGADKPLAGEPTADSTASDGTETALEHALETWEDWDKVDPDALDAWLDGLGQNRTTDPAYPNLTMDILQGTWHGDKNDLTVTVDGNLCTVTMPLLGYEEYTVPCILLNRAAEHNCPSLMMLIYPQSTETGLPLYINAMTRPDRFETTDYGRFVKQ